MWLKLLESHRARVVTGWALAASVAVHATGVIGAWTRPARSLADIPEGPISIRYLLPPDHVERAVGERIQWIAPGTGATGYAAAGGATRATRDPGDAPPPEARRPIVPAAGDAPDETRIFTVEDVDSAAARDPSSDGPRYPDALRQKGVQGEVLVEFTVDTAGHADPATFTVVESTHPLFADAVREALPLMRFTPAVARGHHVRQLVRLPMKFKLMTDEKLTI